MIDMSYTNLVEIEEFLTPSNAHNCIKNLGNDNIRFLLDDLQPRLDIVLKRLDQRGIQVALTAPTKANKKAKYVTYERFRHGWEIVDLYYDKPSNTDIQFRNLDRFERQIFSKLSKNEEQQEFDF
ncbi:hypothetical protein F0249_17725 [Vibrio sp. 03-59-1]|uniref:hypothetical protein n=1 Tax=Vibrio sp. 03-59-1 TaxID=2607607 RepID=UPI0014936D72|nr:hypothetical protein [Vibrio sp. 03-59-1]NOH85638.1 hypothetical protein [Vibrio sp. 03-59-1]